MTCTDCLAELTEAFTILSDGMVEVQQGRSRIEWIMKDCDRLSAAVAQMVLCMKEEE
jgi:hypothetical protein